MRWSLPWTTCSQSIGETAISVATKLVNADILDLVFPRCSNRSCIWRPREGLSLVKMLIFSQENPNTNFQDKKQTYTTPLSFKLPVIDTLILFKCCFILLHSTQIVAFRFQNTWSVIFSERSHFIIIFSCVPIVRRNKYNSHFNHIYLVRLRMLVFINTTKKKFLEKIIGYTMYKAIMNL